jgi:hypothetical protein
MAIYDGSVKQMVGRVDISLKGYSSSIIFFSNHTRLKIPRDQQITTTHFHAYLSNNNLANNFHFFSFLQERIFPLLVILLLHLTFIVQDLQVGAEHKLQRALNLYYTKLIY